MVPLQSLASGLLAGGLLSEDGLSNKERNPSCKRFRPQLRQQKNNEKHAPNKTMDEVATSEPESQNAREQEQEPMQYLRFPVAGSLSTPTPNKGHTLSIATVIPTSPEIEVFNPFASFPQAAHRSLGDSSPNIAAETATSRRPTDVGSPPSSQQNPINLTIPPPPSVSIGQSSIHLQTVEKFIQGLQQIQVANECSVSDGLNLHGTTSHDGDDDDDDSTEGSVNDASPEVASALNVPSKNLLRFMEACQSFQEAGKDVGISLGYHYTNQEYLPAIRQHGLLTRTERRKRNIAVRENGSTHGDGIYTSSNPFAFRDFRDHADVALLVLRLSGNTHHNAPVATAGNPRIKVDQLKDADTLTQQRGIGKDLMVLKESCQCVVLGEFPSTMLDRSDTSERILLAHGRIRKLIKHTLRPHFRYKSGESSPLSSSTVPRADALEPITATTTNVSTAAKNQTTAKKSSSSSSPWDKYGLGKRVKRYGCLRYGMPRHCLLVASTREIADKLDSTEQQKSLSKDQECCICFEPLLQQGKSTTVLKLKRCSHAFHHTCLTEALKFDPKCPVCRTVVSEPQGKMPSGKMLIGLDERMTCEGFEPGTWRIRYSMKAGLQRSYHINPGVAFSGTSREAYIPNTEQGRHLLKRLAYAFSRGLTFTIGTSLTSGRDNAIIWGSIHHKTRLRAGPYGYPDPSYWLNVKEELDALGVPPHDDPSLHIVFATRCLTSVNFGYLFAPEHEKQNEKNPKDNR